MFWECQNQLERECDMRPIELKALSPSTCLLVTNNCQPQHQVYHSAPTYGSPHTELKY